MGRITNVFLRRWTIGREPLGRNITVSELLRRDVDEKATIYVENLITEITQEIASEITE